MSPQKKKKFLEKIRQTKPHGPYKREWLHWWFKTFENIHIPNVKVCADHEAPFTALADAFFGESSVAGVGGGSETVYLCWGSRLFGGKTFLAACLARARMIFDRAEVFVLSGSEDQTKQMREYVKGEGRHMRNRGWNAMRSPRNMIRDIQTTKVFLKNGASCEALPASQKAVRSKHGTDLYGDEIDEMEPDILESALGQTYEGSDEEYQIMPLTFLTSTWQHPDGTMEWAFEQAEDLGWNVYTWCYRETHANVGGHVTERAIEIKRGEMTRSSWMNEVELGRPATEDLIFDPDVLEFVFDDRDYGFATVKRNFTDRIGHDYDLILPAEGETFYHGADWAKHPDFTVISTMIETPNGPDKLANICFRQKEPWPTMLNYLNIRVNQYGGPCWYDGTGMAGDMIEDNILVEAESFDFARRKELHQMYSGFITAVEKGEYVFPNIPFLRKKFDLLTHGQVYESTKVSKKNHTPDVFVSLALARYAEQNGVFGEMLMGRAWD